MAYSDKEIIEKIEAEARKIKPKVLSSKRSAFLNKGRKGGGGCEEVVLYIVGTLSHQLWRYDHINQTKTQVTGPDNRLGKVLAMWGNKFYSIRPCSNTPWYNAVNEFTVDYSTNTYVHSREIEISYPGFVSNACGGAYSATMRDANTIITHWQEPGYQHGDIHVFDISGSVAVPIYVYDLGYFPLGDIVYYPDTDRALLTVRGPIPALSEIGIMLIDLPTGNIVDFLYGSSMSNGYVVSAMYKYGSKTYAVGSATFGVLHGINEVVVTGNTITLGNQWDPNQFSTDLGGHNLVTWRDADSACLDSSSGECYDIGDTGPEGGTIFAVPLGHPQNNGVNQTNFYYEVAKNDIATGGTPSAAFNSICGGSAVHVDLLIDEQLLNYGPYSVPGVWPQQSQVYVTGGASTYQPIVDLFNNFPPVRVEWFAGPPGSPGGSLFGDPNYGWTSHLPSGTTLTNILQNSAGAQNVLEFSNQFTNLANYPLPYGPNPTSFMGYARLTGTPPINPPSPSGFSISGAEWGVHNKPNIITSTDFGTGHINTDAIDAYPLSPGNPTGGIHPWLDSHDIAATLCKQQPSAKDDWFLPSRDEFTEMIAASNTYNFPLGLNVPPGSFMEHAYWTSSQYRPDPANPIQDPHKYSWSVWNVGGGTPMLAYRCHALSVRPIRRFECEPTPPCTGCNCVEYNYRDGSCGKLDGSICSSSVDPNGTLAPSIWWNTTNAGTTPGTAAPSVSDSVIGGEQILLKISRHDVLGGVYSNADFNNSGSGFKISVWDANYNFIGKWKYDFWMVYGGGGAYDRLGTNQRLELWLDNVQHLEGNYPVVYYGGKWDDPGSGGTATGVFFKIEWDGNSGNYETGCNSSIFGNPQPYYTPQHQDDWPWYCGPLHDPSDGSFTGVNRPIPRYATYQPLDNIGNPIAVHPDIYTANPSYTGGGQIGTGVSEFLALGACDCDYQVGDTGPGGGIIVATPWMNINSPSDGCVGPITPALQGMTLKNPTDYYYEISPENLNDGGNDYITFGNSGVNLDNISSYTTPDVNVVFCPPSNLPPGQITSIENIGQGEQATQDIMATTSGNPTFSYPIWGFTTPIQPVSAFEVCDNYSSNGYNDWFLPTTYEMEFARNYSPPGTLVSTLPFSWEANMLQSANGPLPNAYWTCNAEISTTPMLNRITDYDYTQNTGFAVSGDSFAGYTGPNGYLYRWRVSRGYPLNVRAMRKFKCNNNNSPIANNKRSKFVQKKLQTKEVGPFGVYGYYPLYGTIEGATKASPESSYHIHEFEGFEYYMPNGLEMGVTQFHGDWDPKKPTINIENVDIEDGESTFEEQPKKKVTQPEQQRIILPDEPEETPPPVFIPEPEPDTEPTYVPPPPTRSRGGGESSGGY